jgi:alanine dehydrogenase
VVEQTLSITIMKIADKGVHEALRDDPGLAKGLNIYEGSVTHPTVAETFNLPLSNPEAVVWG